jgi:hypothetical protein
MRALILALAIAGVAGAANAGAGTAITNGEVPVPAPTPRAPDGVRAQAETAVKHDLGDPASATFRAVKVMEVASVRHGPFAERIDGPVSIVCGQYDPRVPTGGDGGYAWFFVAIKHGHVLWTADDVTAGADEAYDSCKGAGLAGPSTAATGAFR